MIPFKIIKLGSQHLGKCYGNVVQKSLSKKLRLPHNRDKLEFKINDLKIAVLQFCFSPILEAPLLVERADSARSS